jgi:hypothetical protein
MTDDELIRALRLQSEHVSAFTIFDKAADRIEELLKQIETVLIREAQTQARHDNKIDALDAELNTAVNVIKNLINLAPEGDEDEWHIALDDAAEALAKIKGEAK